MSSGPLEKLQEKLDKDLSWRKKELTFIKGSIDSAEGDILNTLIRAGISILYAHWEGYIKISARNYLDFLNKQNHKLSDLKENFLVLHLTKAIIDVKQSNKKTKYASLLDRVFNYDQENFRVQYRDSSIITTESNLNFDTLSEILFSIGLDSEKYELKRKFIDRILLENRNKIAHGEYTVFVRKRGDTYLNEDAREEFLRLYHAILELMDEFKDQIISAGLERAYLRR
ncbi:MAE_28990/MAE_18760 family HEPN-like nuclease [Bacillus atrophaeus]|uniref:MAE_28990/MAE_18760 family HEPN-like nuclease n=1 Tax=Bacillus atrophaeus TaxID=1452 RepID=UPI000B455D7C|nr:MAE_28990/MAE_18760 family HEPN-like nuclease [Bacillus atrophaeus]ARW05666.1 hypothetical protein S101359_00638 [Bacillus atrophaeus]